MKSNVVNVDFRALLKKDDGLRFKGVQINDNESMVFDTQSNTAIKIGASSFEMFSYEWVKIPFMEGEHLALRKYEN